MLAGMAVSAFLHFIAFLRPRSPVTPLSVGASTSEPHVCTSPRSAVVASAATCRGEPAEGTPQRSQAPSGVVIAPKPSATRHAHVKIGMCNRSCSRMDSSAFVDAQREHYPHACLDRGLAARCESAFRQMAPRSRPNGPFRAVRYPDPWRHLVSSWLPVESIFHRPGQESRATSFVPSLPNPLASHARLALRWCVHHPLKLTARRRRREPNRKEGRDRKLVDLCCS